MERLGYQPAIEHYGITPSILHPEIPLPQDRVPRGEKYQTAMHECHHALVALAVGQRFTSLSLVPDRDSLARVTFSGIVDVSKFSTIAAASMLPSPGYETPWGYGGDVAQIQMIGSSVEAHMKGAKTHLDRFPPELRERIAQIVSCYDEVSEPFFRKIIDRAAWELDWERKYPDVKISHIIAAPAESTHQEETNPKTYTTIEYLKNGQHRVRHHYEDGHDEFHILCYHCGGADNTHAPECPAVRIGEKSGIIFSYE